jgi:DNA invertase Pin-like site-specific DNA recombinase
MKQRIAIYIRTSPHQSDDVGERVEELRSIATGLGWAIETTLQDRAGLEVKRRPAIDRLRKLVAGGQIDIVIVPTLTALAGSLDDLVTVVAGLHAAGCRLYARDEGIDTTTANGAAWMSAMAVAVTFRAKVRQERVREGVVRAKAAGVKFGRACIPTAKLKAVREHLRAGMGIRPTSRLTGVSPARVLQERDVMRAEQDGEKLAA